MPVFTYIARDTEQRERNGALMADTPKAARDALRAQGFRVCRVTEQKAGTASGGRTWRGGGRVSPSLLNGAYRELSTLLAVGIPLAEALQTVAGQQSPALRHSLLMLRDGVCSGQSLTESMRRQPRYYDAVALSLVEVGERSGTLEQSLQRLAELRERSLQFKGKLGTALVYPATVVVVGVVVSLFLMTFVVPKLLGVLEQSGKPLPSSTRLVKGASDLLLQGWWALMAAGVGVTWVAVLAMRRPVVRSWWDGFQLRLPVLGPLLIKQAVSRVSLVIATLCRSGVGLIASLELAESATSNTVIRRALREARASVTVGREIAEALGGGTGVLPPTVVQVFAVGQASGRLEEMLERLSGDYDQQVAAATARLTAMLEPILILLLAVWVGLIAFATMMPILEAGDVL